MDINCATCQEPWEHHHLLRDLVWDAWDGEDDSSLHTSILKFLESDKSSIPQVLRERLADEGWKFGKTIVCVLECGCCASNAGEGEDEGEVATRKEIRLEAESLLCGDLDGLISTLSSIDSIARMSL